MKKKTVFLISVLLALVFGYASGLKLWAYMHSKTGFGNFPFVEDYASVLFWGLMSGQLAIAFFVLLRKTRLSGLYTAFFVLASLSTYLYVMLHYAKHIPCFCTGILPGLSWEGHLWFTVGFTLLAGIGIVLLPKDIHARE